MISLDTQYKTISYQIMIQSPHQHCTKLIYGNIIIIIIRLCFKRPLIWHVNLPWEPQTNKTLHTQTLKTHVHVFKIT